MLQLLVMHDVQGRDVCVACLSTSPETCSLVHLSEASVDMCR